MYNNTIQFLQLQFDTEIKEIKITKNIFSHEVKKNNVLLFMK